MQYRKLVRDRIPDIVRKDGKVPVTHSADVNEYEQKLLKKLQEEVREFLENNDVKELADILEVVYAIGDLKGSNRATLERLRQEKAASRGSFTKRIILDETK